LNSRRCAVFTNRKNYENKLQESGSNVRSQYVTKSTEKLDESESLDELTISTENTLCLEWQLESESIAKS